MEWGLSCCSPLFHLALEERWPGSTECGLRPFQVPPCRAPGKAPLPGGKNAAGRSGDFPVPTLPSCPWRLMGGKHGVGTFLSPLFHLALEDQWPGSMEWGLSYPHSSVLLLEIDGREAWSGDFPVPTLPVFLLEIDWREAKSGDFPVPYSSVLLLEIDGREARSGTPSLLGPPCRAPGKAPPPSGKNAAAPTGVGTFLSPLFRIAFGD